MQPYEDVITKQGGNENVPNSINYQTQYQIITDQLPLKAPLENDASFHQEEKKKLLGSKISKIVIF
jgi:hypothetical protein